MDLIYSVSSFFVGLLVGLTGVGGGSLMTPLLIFLFGFSPATAVGTDLLFAAATKTVGAGVHGYKKTVEWRIVAFLSLGSLPAAALTLWALKILKANGTQLAPLITHVLGLALILTALSLILKGFIARLNKNKAPNPNSPGRFKRYQTPITILVGVVLGVLVTISSIGAGALGTVALLFLYPGLPVVRIVGADIAHAIPLTALAGLGHWHMGNVDFTLLGYLLLGSVPGIYIGSHLSTRFPENLLRPVLASVLMLVGLKFVL